MMKNKLPKKLLVAILFSSSTLAAQVQVSKEPRHKNELENKYLRLLDVKIPPGDTTLLHIHSTASVFLHFTNTMVGSQIKGQEWKKARNIAGSASYRSFLNDTLVHRVSNLDRVPFHVTDVELLSPYKPAKKLQPLPFTLLFENEKVIAYRLTTGVFNKQVIKNRGPMIAELVTGSEVILRNKKGKNLLQLKVGNYVYIKPGTAFYFSAKENEETNLVLFEIK